MADLEQPIEAASLAFLDFETTGLDPSRGDRVVEIGLLRTRGQEIEVEYESLVNPQRPIGYGASRVNHISDQMLVGAPSFVEVADQVLTLLNGTVVVAHNAMFDLSFLSAELRLAQRPLPSLVALDTLTLARNNVTSSGYSLAALCEMYGIVQDQAHRALADVYATRELFVRLARLLRRRGVHTVGDFVRAQGGALKDRGGTAVEVPPLIRDALRTGKLMRIRYRDSYGSTTERLIKPVEMSNRFGQLYLVAHCYLRHAQRTFALDRIQDMAVTDESAPETR
ncbi:MAG: exonuclease domain-containing protein [Anaerolineae bacterium]